MFWSNYIYIMISCQWLQGYDCTAGMQSCIDQPVSDDAVIVKVKAFISC